MNHFADNSMLHIPQVRVHIELGTFIRRQEGQFMYASRKTRTEVAVWLDKNRKNPTCKKKFLGRGCKFHGGQGENPLPTPNSDQNIPAPAWISIVLGKPCWVLIGLGPYPESCLISQFLGVLLFVVWSLEMS